MSDIFISYKREDKTEAKTLAESLEQVGWTVWWDPQLRAGERFDEVIERELNNAKCVIVLWSRRAIQSQYVKDEAAYALSLNKLIPVTIDEVSPPFRFQGLHTLSLAGWEGSASAPPFRKLQNSPAETVKSPPPRKVSPKKPKPKAPAKATQVVEPDEPDGDDDASDASTFGLTAVYGGFKETHARDIYTLRVYVNLFAGVADAERRAKQEFQKFLKDKGYSSYKIINRRDHFFLRYYDYTVQFKRK
jgi:hypothetical protein